MVPPLLIDELVITSIVTIVKVGILLDCHYNDNAADSGEVQRMIEKYFISRFGQYAIVPLDFINRAG
jgi:hypothetical protein